MDMGILEGTMAGSSTPVDRTESAVRELIISGLAKSVCRVLETRSGGYLLVYSFANGEPQLLSCDTPAQLSELLIKAIALRALNP